jgi:hypothetical protein
MREKPDFYLYGGDGPRALEIIRACWRLAFIQSEHGTDILVASVDPPIPMGQYFEGLEESVIGLASRVRGRGPADFGGAALTACVLWRVSKSAAEYKAEASVGLATIWKDPPAPQESE